MSHDLLGQVTQMAYRNIPKMSPWAYIRSGLSVEENLRFKID